MLCIWTPQSDSAPPAIIAVRRRGSLSLRKTAPDGTEIIVGKNSAQNDRVTGVAKLIRLDESGEEGGAPAETPIEPQIVPVPGQGAAAADEDNAPEA